MSPDEREIAAAAGLESEAEVELLAELLAEEGLLDEPPSAGPRIVARDPGAELVLAHGQLRLWFVEQLAPGEPIYNIPVAVSVPAALDPAVLARAVEALIERHEVLRLRIETRDGEPRPWLAPAEPFEIPLIDLRGQPRERCEALAREEAERPFDLSRDPPLRMGLIARDGPSWLLCLTLHHMVADAWSVPILVAELAQLCEAGAEGRAELGQVLPPLAISYFDYAAWQRRSLTRAALVDELDWWAAQLDGAEPTALFPDRPAPARPSFRGARLVHALAPDLVARLRAASAARGQTLFASLHAGLVAVLARLSGAAQVCIGTVVSGREQSEVQALIGFFANTLVLRVDVADDPELDSLSRRCQAVIRAAQAHAEVPFSLVIQRLGLGRASHQPLFRVALVMARDRLADTLGPFERQRVHAGRARFDLTLYAIDDGETLRIEAEYSRDRFDEVGVTTVLNQYVRALASLVDEPRARVSELRLSDPAERAFIESRARAQPGPEAPAHVVEGFVAALAAGPEREAVLVVDEDPAAAPTPTSYAELGARAAGLAEALAARGIGPGDAVALSLPRDATLLAAMLAVLARGATLVPLSSAIPTSRRATILRDVDARLVLAAASEGEELEFGADVEQLDPASLAPGSTPAELPAPPPSWPRLRAYVLHTSGSTGRPKGVAVDAGALASVLAVVCDELGLGPGDRMLASAAVTFDIALVELLGPLVRGATVVLGPEPVRGDPRWLAAVIEGAQIGLMQSTPSTWAALVAAGWSPRPGMRILAGGEALPSSLTEALLEGGARVWNGYGPTEASIYATFERVEPGRSVGIGGPLPGREAWVLDPAGELAPLGAPGELHLGGGLAEGYVRQPAETAARFIPADGSLAASPGARLYATGDRVRLRADGRLEYLGRLDGQVKVRGFRIELAEVEGALVQLAGVRRAAVRAREGRLEAYLEPERPDAGADADPDPDTDTTLDPARLNRQLAARLPDYMLPSRYHEVDALPTTTSGKLDRRALDRIAAAELDARAAEAEPPREGSERALAAIWAELLELEPTDLDRRDNFYLRGGHSLLAVRLAVRVEARFGVRLPLAAILAAPTLAGLAARIDEGREALARPALVGAEPPPTRAPLSPNQAAIWRVCALVPRTALFNIGSAFVLPIALPPAVLERALAVLVERHATLRTHVELDGEGEPVQRIDPPAPIDLRIVDLRALEPELRAGVAMREQARVGAAPLELGPATNLLRAALILVDDARSLVKLVVHHLAADGWSMAILLDELAALCGAEARGQAPALARPRFTYADWCLWQRARREDLFAEQQRYWRRRLAGLRPLTLPPDREGDADDLYAAVEPLEVELGPAARARVAQLATRESTTPYVVALAAAMSILARRADDADVRVSTLVANRDLPGSEAVVGCFVNSLVLRVEIRPEATLEQAVARVVPALDAALVHQDLPLDLLFDALDLELPRAELARVQIAPRPHSSPGPRSRSGPGIGVPPMLTSFDLFVEIDASPDALNLLLRYRGDRYARETIVGFTDAIAELLESSP